MKYFVKYTSVILLVILTVVDIGWIAEFCFAVLVLLLIAEIAAKVILYIKSVKSANQCRKDELF